ncbi:MAG: (2Fe-2S)-binding protein [Rhodospirillales bacterium]|jgi:D-hydroxyproline dehydrogenase subunit gamma|nr:(2Fe-2S)-binding protein [Rhodospirillales bacterium]
MKTLHAPNPVTAVTLTIEGKSISVDQGTSVAAAALVSGLIITRTTPVDGSRRAPYCLMGVCYECLMTIDGVANQRACQTIVREGMVVLRQDGKREVMS